MDFLLHCGIGKTFSCFCKEVSLVYHPQNLTVEAARNFLLFYEPRWKIHSPQSLLQHYLEQNFADLHHSFR